ncbi:MAG: hypothetical protein ABI851_07350 [Saprospiraceae bacterium]
MNHIKYISVLLLVFLSFSSCDLLDDSPCGPHTTADVYLLGISMLDKTYFNTYLDGNNRVYQWSQLVENVCTDDHVKSDFRVAILDETSASTYNIKARAKISYQFLYEQNTELKLNGTDFKGNLSVGIKHAFPDLKGWFIHSIEVYFPTKGSADADYKFLFPIDPVEGNLLGPLISIEMTSKFREYK